MCDKLAKIVNTKLSMAPSCSASKVGSGGGFCLRSEESVLSVSECLLSYLLASSKAVNPKSEFNKSEIRGARKNIRNLSDFFILI